MATTSRIHIFLAVLIPPRIDFMLYMYTNTQDFYSKISDQNSVLVEAEAQGTPGCKIGARD